LDIVEHAGHAADFVQINDVKPGENHPKEEKYAIENICPCHSSQTARPYIDDDYQIEFYELSNEENAIDMYATNKIRFETSKGNSSAVTNFDFKNYSKYTLTTNGKYKVLSRIDNTLIYIDVDKDYKDIVKDLLKEIGY